MHNLTHDTQNYMENKKQNSCKIKEAIDLLPVALMEKKEDEKSIFNQPSLSEAIGSCTKSNATLFRQSHHKLYQLAVSL